MRGAERVLRNNGYVLMVCSSDESTELERQYLRVLEEYRVDGLLITPAERDLDRLSVLASTWHTRRCCSTDTVRPTRCALQLSMTSGVASWRPSHLFGLGHETVAFVNGPSSIRQCADRRQGARKALTGSPKRRGAAIVARDHRQRRSPSTMARRLWQRFLAADARPTAVMCANDLIALGVLRGLAETGIAVPDEIAVVGYDDVTFASMLSPGLTSVRQPKYELGETAAELFLEEAWGSAHEHRSVRFEPELIVRASSGKSRR